MTTNIDQQQLERRFSRGSDEHYVFFCVVLEFQRSFQFLQLFPAGVTPGKEQSRPSSRPGSGSAASGSNNSRPASRAGGPPGRPGSAAAAQRGGGSAAGAGNGKFDVRHDDPATLFPPVETSDARKLYAELHLRVE